jgi:hypothetical protein
MIFEKYTISYITKIFPLEAQFFHADGRKEGRRGMGKTTVAFRNCTKARKMLALLLDG